MPVRVYPPGYGHSPLAANYRPWEADVDFLTVWRHVRHNTLLDLPRLYELWELVPQLAATPGDILEVGVWRGGSGALLAARAATTLHQRTIVLADTFAGVAKAGPRDPYYRGGEHADTAAEVVTSLFDAMGLTAPEILVGIFPDETGAAIADRQIALCHIDVDVYESARETFDRVWPQMAAGAVVVFDDYGFLGCEGVTELVHDLRARDDSIVVANANGHAILVKTR